MPPVWPRRGGAGLLTWSGRPSASRRGWRQIADVQRDIPGDVQIEPAVGVVVAEGASRGPAVDGDSRLRGLVGERAALPVPIEPVRAEVGDIQIGEAVVVDVAGADALAPPLVGHARLEGDIAEFPVADVAEQRRSRRWRTVPHAVERRAVHEEHVDEPVLIDVHQRHTGARRFDDVGLAGTPGHVCEGVEPRRSGRVGVAHAGGGVRRGGRNGSSGRQRLCGQDRGAQRREGHRRTAATHGRVLSRWGPTRISSALAKAACARARSPAD